MWRLLHRLNLRRWPMLALGAAALLGVGAAEWVTGAGLPAWGWGGPFCLALALGGLARSPGLRGSAALLAAFSALALMHALKVPAPAELARVTTPQAVTLEATLDWEPKVTDYRTTCTVRVRRWETAQGWVPAAGQRLLITWTGPPPKYGKRVRVHGTLGTIPAPANPGMWNRAAWHAQRGMYFQVVTRYARDCQVQSGGWANPLVAGGFAARDWMSAQLRIGLADTPVTAGILQGLVLGVVESSEPQLFDLFRETGTLHLFAVSGLHVGMVGAFAAVALGMLGGERRHIAAWLIPLLVLYAFITGLQVPVVRSTIIAVIFAASTLLLRRPNLLNSTGTAAVLLLLWDSRQALQVGFQFSFCVVLTIIVLGDWALPHVRSIGAPDRYIPRALWTRRQEAWLAGCQWLVALLLGSTAAWLGSLPLMLAYNRLVSWISLPANLAVIPLSFLVVVAGLVAIILAGLPGIGAYIAGGLNQFSWLVIQGIMWVLDACWHVPGGYAYTRMPPRLAPPAFSASVLSIPRGGGAVSLQAGGSHWLVDCAGDLPFALNVAPSLRHAGWNRAEGIILTHQDSAHTAGQPQALVSLRPQVVYTAPGLKLPGTQTQPRPLTTGDVITLSSQVELQVLWPPPGLQRGSADDRCLVLRAKTPAGYVLLMGDSGFATEAALLEMLAAEPGALRAEVLILHGHARDLYGTPAFLAAVQPRHVILAGEERNPPAFLPADLRPGAQIWRTHQQGGIYIESAQNGLDVGVAR